MASGRRILHAIDSNVLIIAGLSLLAALSPLVTLLRLWQLKEWRLDRLWEHLQAEGILRMLWGTVRFALILGLGLISLLVFVAVHRPGGDTLGSALAIRLLPHLGLGLLIAVTIAQAALGKLRLPVWTPKACLMMLLAVALNIGLLLRLPLEVLTYWYPVLILAGPLFLGAAWLLLLPLDTVMKRSILRSAKEARDALPVLTVIAVCGSVGKTTTKELLKNALCSIFPVVTPAYVNSEIGVAQWFLREWKAKRIHSGSTVVLEMGGYRRGEVRLLCSIFRPTIGIVTAVGSQHIALYGSMQNILEAEREMPSLLPKNGLLLVNGDDGACAALASSSRCTVVSVGTRDGVDLRATDIREEPDGLSFVADERNLRVPLFGSHNVTNVLLAFAAAKAVGLDGGEIADALRSPLALTHTFAVSTRRQVTVLDDTHNLSPQSAEAAVRWAATRPERPRVLLTTGLIEQGRLENKEMRRYGEKAKTAFERVIFVGTRGRRAFEEGYGKVSESLRDAQPVPAGALLAAVGRVPSSALRSLVP